MNDDSRHKTSAQDRQAEVAREIFVRERGAHPGVPFPDFLARIEAEAREQVQKERRARPRLPNDDRNAGSRATI